MFTASLVAQKQALTFDGWLGLHVLLFIHSMFICHPPSKACFTMCDHLCLFMACIAMPQSLNLSLKSLSEQKYTLHSKKLYCMPLFLQLDNPYGFIFLVSPYFCYRYLWMCSWSFFQFSRILWHTLFLYGHGLLHAMLRPFLTWVIPPNSTQPSPLEG